MTSTTTLLSFCLAVAGVGPCGGTPPARHEVLTAEPREVAERPREVRQQQTPTTQTFMREHTSEALDMRWAVIAGRFDQLHRAAAIVASDAWSPHLRPDYLPHVTAVRNAANAALDARSTGAAGAALGELGVACASCHREKGGPPQLTAIETLPRGVGTMAAHVAAERALWEGLITPSAASWKRGAESLAGAPELASDVADVSALAQEVRDVARQAAAGEPRGDVYGKIMATCSTCHRRLDVRPR
jgi:cytochrome c556